MPEITFGHNVLVSRKELGTDLELPVSMIRTRNAKKHLLYALFGLLSFNLGCNVDSGLGATPGGVQDITFARNLVESGNIPPAEAFFVEGMFSEHDLPLEGKACETTLCIRAATGLAPDDKNKDSGWVQVGLSSNVNPDNYVHPSQTIIAVVDVSGSMRWTYESGGQEKPLSPGQVSRQLMHKIADRLRPQDNFAIVTFGSDSDVALEITPGSNREDIKDAIDDLDEGGSTNMEKGLEVAYELASKARTNTENTRLILFTDVQPNVGATESSAFRKQVEAGARKDISLTVIGAGIGMGAQVFEAMADLKGGNAFSLSKGSEVSELMENNWPWMLVPIAHDLKLSFEDHSSIKLSKTYGFPNGSEQEIQANLEVSTVFLSQKRGALLAKFRDPNQTLIGQTLVAKLSYKDLNGSLVQSDLELTFPTWTGTTSAYVFEQESVGRTTALALLVTSMKDAATIYEANQAEAVAIMTNAVERIESDAAYFKNTALNQEVDFAKALLKLIEDKAPQGSFYHH